MNNMDLMNPNEIMSEYLKLEDESEKLIFSANITKQINELPEEQQKQAKANIVAVLKEVSRKASEVLNKKSLIKNG